MKIKLIEFNDEAHYLRNTANYYKQKFNLGLKLSHKNTTEYFIWLEKLITKEMSCFEYYCECEQCSENSDVLIVRKEGEYIGGFTAFYDDEEAEIEFFVSPSNIGKGLGVEVLSRGIAWIRRYRPEITYLRADCVNEASEKLCLKLGFKREICGDYFLYIYQDSVDNIMNATIDVKGVTSA